MRFFISLTTVFISALFSGCANQPKTYFDSAKSHLQEIELNDLVTSELSESESKSLADIIDIQSVSPWLKKVYERSFELKISDAENKQRALLIDHTKSYQLPEVSLLASANRSKINEFQQQYQSTYQMGAQVSWEVDLWNKIGLRSGQARLDYTMSLTERKALKRSLTVRALKQLLSYHALTTQLNKSRKTVTIFMSLSDQAKQAWQSGLISLSDFEQAKERALSATTHIHNSELELDENERLLRQLAHMETTETLPILNSQVDLPKVAISGKYLLQRPDVQQALLQIQKLDIEGQIAYRSLFPSFTLSLDASQTAVGNQNLLGQDPLWQLLGQLSAPIFEGGRLRRNIDIAEQESRKTFLSYKQQIHGAYYEIQGMLSKEANFEKMRQHRSELIANVQGQVFTSLKAYQNGTGDYASYTSNQIKLIEQQQENDRIELERALNRIDLFLALGLPLQNEG